MRYRYKPTYGDKQRQAQKRAKEQQLGQQEQAGQVKPPVAENSNVGEDRQKQQDKGAA